MTEETIIKENISNPANQKISVTDLCQIAVFAAIISVTSQISIPMPAGVPMTLQTLIIPIAGIVLGRKKGTVATLIYLLMGAVGIPVFAGFSGGLGKLLGITGGFLISFPVLSYTAGLGDKLGRKASFTSKKYLYYIILVASLLIGATINYIFGTIWFVVSSGSSVIAALSACVIPFIPTALLKIALITIIAPMLKQRLGKLVN